MKSVICCLLLLCMTAPAFAQEREPTTPPEPNPYEEPVVMERPTPFDQGKFYVSIGGGYVSSNIDSYFTLSAGVGYFVLKGLELGLATEFSLGRDPFVGTVSPRLTYYLHQIPVIHPYIGAFYSHWFIGDGFDDLDSIGARAGVVSINGPLLLAIGAVYETILNCDVCDDEWYPEISIGISF